MKQVDFIYDAGLTKRYHTMHVIRQQTIADHSWHVAMLGYVLYGQDEPGVTPQFLMALLTHDAAEYKVGDVPSPAKRGMAELLGPRMPSDVSFFDVWGEMEQSILAEFQMDWDKFLSEEEKRRLALLDALEGAFFCITERSLGNKNVDIAFQRYCTYIGKTLEDVGEEVYVHDNSNYVHREWEIFNYLQRKWSEVIGN
jgi:5'-deoxynucleotidase YfbR-like HD superfamily hydrolase